ncbi:MAG: hypothetical protein [Caudoviricetes sp.]|nr:MAG: hypothetical protein [Caudoviricetes sp.]
MNLEQIDTSTPSSDQVIRSLIWQLRAESQLRQHEHAKSSAFPLAALLDSAADAVEEIVNFRAQGDSHEA